MFIVKWLMSHPILFAWALAALAIILNWGSNKSGVEHVDIQDVAAVHSQQTDEAKAVHGNNGNAQTAQQVAVDAHTPASPEQPVVPAAPVNEFQKPVHPEKPGMDSAVPTQEVKAVTADPSQQAVAAVAKVASAENVQAEATVEVASTENVAVSTVIEQAAAPVAEIAATSKESVTTTAEAVTAAGNATVAPKAATPDDLLNAAREAFWHNKKEEAASIYKQLIEMQPEVLEHKGELGNVYWHQNKQKESAALYGEIAIPLIKKGKSAQVENMLGFIGAFYPEKATEIHQYLMNNQ